MTRTNRLLRISPALTVLVGLGLLDAPPASTGDLDPPGPPGPTMKSLDEIPGSWHRMLDSTNGDANGCNSDRFKCVMNNDEAVLDLETGLVWQRTPDPETTNQSTQKVRCHGFTSTGGRMGWRLPGIAEMLSLRDESQGPPHLPAGHPFVGIGASDNFWTADEARYFDGTALNIHGWVVAMDDAVTTPVFGPADLLSGTTSARRWCVRGPSPHSGGY